jgi:hypothetical protein
MGRNFAAILIAIACLVSVATAEQIKTTETRWSYRLPLPDGVSGAESLAFYGKDGFYTGVSDGRVLKWGGTAVGWSTFAYNANYRSVYYTKHHIVNRSRLVRCLSITCDLFVQENSSVLRFCGAVGS